MIRLIEALNYRCLKYIRQELKDFHVLVGPNASGKTTFLDVVSFLGDLVATGLVETAVHKRTSSFHDLLFNHQGDRFELAVEMEIPEDKRKLLPPQKNFDRIRYEIAVAFVPQNEAIHIVDEKAILMSSAKRRTSQKQKPLFPQTVEAPMTLTTSSRPGQRFVVTKKQGGNDNYHSEVHEKGGKGWAFSIRLGQTKSALANLPADEDKFPVAAWLRDILREGVEQIMLNSLQLRRSSPPGQGLKFKPDGSNLPWVINHLKKEEPQRFQDWVGHLQTALPDIQDIHTVELPDTRHRYIKLIYRDNFGVPAWMASDGTLRLLALTLPAYLTDFKGIYLIEEPENGIHPLAMETAFQSLSSVYSAQILMATHSPVILSHARPEDVLCLSKDEQGAADVVLGSRHPALQNWRGEVDFSLLYASGVLG
jgi:predicted ATPase